MTRPILYFGITIYTFFCHAADVSKASFKIAGEKIEFYQYKKLQLTISKPCDKAVDGKLCSDLDFLNKIKYKDTGREGTGNENPGATVCKKLVKGTIYIGEDGEKNQMSFCLLPDGRYIGNGTLFHYAQKNDGFVLKPRGTSK